MKHYICVGGSIHGQYRPDGFAYLVQDGHVYWPQRLRMTGWKVSVPAYVERDLSMGRANIPEGTILPGCVQNMIYDRVRVCLWCFREAMPDQPHCRRTACITHVVWLESVQAAWPSDVYDWDRS